MSGHVPAIHGHGELPQGCDNNNKPGYHKRMLNNKTTHHFYNNLQSNYTPMAHEEQWKTKLLITM